MKWGRYRKSRLQFRVFIMKDIKGYEGLYAATEEGKIWAYPKTSYINAGRWKEGRFLKTWLIGHGYEMVMLYKDGLTAKFLVHRLVAQTFIPNHDNLREVNHLDADIRNNRVDNLEWSSSKSNKMHSRNLGRPNKVLKLTDEKVREIRRLYREGMYQRDIAIKYGITQGNVSSIIRGATWSHIVD